MKREESENKTENKTRNKKFKGNFMKEKVKEQPARTSARNKNLHKEIDGGEGGSLVEGALSALSSAPLPLSSAALSTTNDNDTGTGTGSGLSGSGAGAAGAIQDQNDSSEQEDDLDENDEDEDDDEDGQEEENENVDDANRPPTSRNGLLMLALRSQNDHERLSALQDLSEILVVATEDDFMRPSASSLNPPSLVNTLVSILSSRSGPDYNSFSPQLAPDLMILACRCLCNLIFAYPPALSLLAHSNGISALVEKLMEIEYIDLAETALKVLEEVSVEFPSTILKANGLFASLQFIDFFGIHVQRTAVAIVANTVRSLPTLASPPTSSSSSSSRDQGLEALSKISMIMDTLIRLLGYSDQKIMTNSAKSLARITDWVCKSPSNSQHITTLFMPAHIKELVRLLAIYSEPQYTATFHLLVTTLAKLAKSSPDLRALLFGEGVLRVVKGIIGTDGSEKDVIGFAITRPADQVLALLDLVNNLLPALQAVGVWRVLDDSDEVKVVEVVDDSVIQTYLDLLLPVLLEVFMTSSAQAVRKRIVLCVAKVISYGEARTVATHLKQSKRFGKFVYELVHYHKSCILASDGAVAQVSSGAREEQLLVFAGISIAMQVAEKFGDEFLGWFGREGVLSELARLNEKCTLVDSTPAPNATTIPVSSTAPVNAGGEVSSSMEGGVEFVEMLQDFLANPGGVAGGVGGIPEAERTAIATRLEQVKRMIYRESSNTANQGVFYGFTSEKLTQSALLTRIYDLSDRLVAMSGTFNSPNEISGLLIQLIEAGTEGESVEKCASCLNIIASKMTETGNDFSSQVTHFELFSGKLVEVLISFLSSPAPLKDNGHKEMFKLDAPAIEWRIELRERILLFMAVFFDVTKGDSAFSSLILHLQEYISRLDLLPIMSASSSESIYPGRENLYGLSKQLKLQLSPLDPSNSNTSNQMNVYVPAVASFKVLENYIQTRLQSASSGGGASSSSAAVITDEDQQGDSEIEEDEIDISDSPFASSALEMSINLEKSASQASSTSASSNSKIPKLAATITSQKQYISFFINGKEVSNDSTIFGAFYHALPSSETNDISMLWKNSHTLQFNYSSRRSLPLSTSSKKQTNLCTCTICNQFYQLMGYEKSDGFSACKELSCALFLIGLLNQLNSKYSLNRGIKSDNSVFLSPLQFVNNKLSTKVARQIAEPLMSVSGIYPAWQWSLVYNYSFLLPFDLRLKFLKVTAMGYARNMSHWLEFHRPAQPSRGSGGGPRLENSVRADRLKVRIKRDAVFESLVKLLGMDGHHKTMLEVEFFNEVGSGLGPTLEFFTLACKCIRARKGVRRSPLEKRSLIWRSDDDDASDDKEYLNPRLGLYPRPCTGECVSIVSSIFYSLGSFVAKSFLDSRQLDLQFNPLFIEQLFSEFSVLQPESIIQNAEEGILKVKAVSPQLYQSLVSLKNETSSESFDAMSLDFTLPGFPDYELLPGGAIINVTSENIDQYIKLVVDATVGSGVFSQLESFRKGFHRIIPIHYFGCFTQDEIMNIIGGESNNDWTVQVLSESLKVDHGYNFSSRLIQQLIEMLCQFSPEERRLFLSFCTGSPRLPIGGFAALRPPLTIVRKSVEKNEPANDYLPSVMTCAHYLKVPEYSSPDVMRDRFLFAMKEGQNSFHLS